LIMTGWSREIMASREELLRSIQPGMKLDKAFFLKVYGYELTWPGFAETAIKALEDAGCSNARNYYISAVSGYQWNYRQQIKSVGEWYLKECKMKREKKQKGSEEQRRQEIMKVLHQKSDRELLSLLQTLN
jgi:hypothetical protein